jgi:transcriptional regulator with XRE-family HTH domain
MTPLREYRKAAGVTLADLAPRVGVTEGQLSRIERFGGASLTTAAKIEELTGLSAASFVKAPAEDAA